MGNQGKYMKYFSFPWTPLVATLLILTLFLFIEFFCEGINKNKGDCHQCRIIKLSKIVCLEIIHSVGQ